MTQSEVQVGKRRVLLIDLGAHFGGVETYHCEPGRPLDSEVELYVLCVLPELSERLAGCAVSVIRLPVFPGMFKPLRFLAAFIVVPFRAVAVSNPYRYNSTVFLRAS